MASYTIGTLAEAAGVRRDTIRYYERIGLMKAPGRTAAGYRLYGEQDRERINFIRTAQSLGFTLSQTDELLSLRDVDGAKAIDVLRVTEAKISELRDRVAQLEDIRRALQDLAADCPMDAPASDCPILAYLSGGGAGASAQRPPAGTSGNHV